MPNNRMFYIADCSNTMWAVEECGLALLCPQKSGASVRRTAFYFETAKNIASDLSSGIGIELHVIHINDDGAYIIDYSTK